MKKYTSFYGEYALHLLAANRPFTNDDRLVLQFTICVDGLHSHQTQALRSKIRSLVSGLNRNAIGGYSAATLAARPAQAIDNTFGELIIQSKASHFCPDRTALVWLSTHKEKERLKLRARFGGSARCLLLSRFESQQTRDFSKGIAQSRRKRLKLFGIFRSTHQNAFECDFLIWIVT